MSYDKTLAELNRAMNRGYLVNCYLNQSGEAAIILTNITAADNYVTVICPTAAAPIKCELVSLVSAPIAIPRFPASDPAILSL